MRSGTTSASGAPPSGSLNREKARPAAPGGEATFEVKGVKEGPFVITATLPEEHNRETTTIRGNVIATPNEPAIFRVSPPNGSMAGGTSVEVSGALLTADCSVSFGGVPVAGLTFVNAETLRVIAPAHAPGTVDVVATCGGEVSTLARAFTYAAAGANISAVAVSSGTTNGGTFVRIIGGNIANSCWPFFGGVASPVATVVDASTMLAVTPAHAAGAVDLRLLCTGTDALLRNGFTYVNGNDAAPQILEVDPLFATPGDVVTLSGIGFRPHDVITFDDRVALIVSSTPESHIVVVPDMPAGQVSVNLSRADGASATTGPIFTIGESSPPRVSRVTATAAAGAEIVLEGTGLRRSYSFAIGGKALQLVSLSPTRAVVRLPNDLVAGTHAIQLMNAQGRIAALAPAVIVRANGVVVAEVEARCASTDGEVDVTISGRGFAPGASVTFDGVPATNITVVDATRITATVPANAAGPAVITVTNGDGTSSTLTDAFRYFSPFDPSACRNTPSRTRSVRH
jgi:hypothetical protein